MIKAGAIFIKTDEFNSNLALAKAIQTVNECNTKEKSLIDIRPVATTAGIMLFYLYNEDSFKNNKVTESNEPDINEILNSSKNIGDLDIKEMKKMLGIGGCESCDD